MRERQAYEETLAKYGIRNVTIVDAKYDPVVQSEQRETIIQSKPDILFMLPAEPAGIAEAVQHALDAGIPVFCNDSPVQGLVDKITCLSLIDQYSEGYGTMEKLAQKLNGKGKLGMIWLDANASWHLRDIGALDCMKKYPGLQIVQEWSWDSTGVFTPRMAVDDFLTASKVGELDGVWCAWDGGALEGIQACEAAGRKEIIFTGCDGGGQAIETILGTNQFLVSAGPSFYSQVSVLVDNAIKYMKGEPIPHIIYSDNVLLTKEGLAKANSAITGSEKLSDYDKPGNAQRWGLETAPYQAPPL
jgi:ribose transport system substrate-binding protein